MATRFTRQWKLAVVWTLFLLLVGAASFSAQAPGGVPQSQLGDSLITESPTVISGNDIGFRIERTQDGIAVGKLVVRVDGRWVNTDMTIAGQRR